MKNIYLLILPLMLASLACLQTTITATPDPIATISEPSASPQSASLQEPDSGAVFEPVTPEPHKCAKVTAIQSLNLRQEPSEKSRVIYWLQAMQQVTIIERESNWWMVSADGRTGYAKADYLTETECK